ncbi:MAG TPA: ferredoxin family protein [Solirubrobacteraceae bacterium]|nr:ferredoxin family protein [Solirubrobacteraceae bacterium]
MIEFINADTCTNCNRCVEICPTDVFEPSATVVQIARRHDCTSCMNCELYCPTDSIYVSPIRTPEVDLDEAAVIASGILGSYRRAMNWENGQPPQGTGDNWGLQLRQHRGEHPPPEGDRDYAIRLRLYNVRDRNLIATE